MNSVFGVLHHFRMRLQPDKNQKYRRQKVLRFYCWRHNLSHISGHGCDKWIRFSVFCIIFRCAYSQIKSEKSATKIFLFYCWQHILVHISGHGCDKWIRFTVFCIIYKCAYSRIKISKSRRQRALRFYCWQDIFALMIIGVINEFGFRCLHHFRMRLQPGNNQKNRQQKVDLFYCSKFTANLTVFLLQQIYF